MELKKYIYPLFLASLLFAGCKSDDYGDGTTPLGNVAYIDVAEIKPDVSVVIKKDVDEYSRSFSVKLISPAPSDAEVGVAVDNSRIESYNHRHGTSYEALPSEYYSLETKSVRLEKGKVLSEPVTISFKGVMSMELDKSYLLPVSITDISSGIGLLNGSETVYYLVKRSSAITTGADLTENYMWIPSYETADGWSALEGFKELTYEAIVNINNFTRKTSDNYEISVTSVMGVEEHCLMRIGDSNYPRQQIQMKVGETYWPANSRDFLVPSITLQPGEWYHLAFTWNLSEGIGRLYVNGREAYEAPLTWHEDTFDVNRLKEGGADDKGRRFFIGYSYDRDRPLNGLISEVRVWSVARTEEEIYRNMYKIEEPDKLPELRAYWKFDEGSGNIVKDHSQYGNDAHSLDGKNKFESGERDEGTLGWNTNVEIPILNSEK